MIANLRDLGGIGTRDGRRIRKGCLVRSAHLALAEERDLKGVSAVINPAAARHALSMRILSAACR